MNNTSTMKYLLLLLICLFTNRLYADDVSDDALADSIRRELPSLKGSERIKAYSNLCRIAAQGDDPAIQLGCIREYIAEADKQGDTEAESEAKTMQIFCYYNYDMLDSIERVLPHHLEFMSKYGYWDCYYNSWNVLIESYIYLGKLQTALVEARKMYADAQTRHLNHGLGISAYGMGNIYQTMQRYPEARKSYEESISALSKEEDISMLLTAYNNYTEVLDALHDYPRIGTASQEWKQVIDTYKVKAEKKGYTPSLNGRYLQCYLAMTIAETEAGSLEKAAELLRLAEELAEGRNQTARYRFLYVQSRYYTATKEYQKAMVCNDENIKLLQSIGDSVSSLTVEYEQAGLLLKAGKPLEAALLYQQLIPRKDSLRSTELATQLDELSTIYKVDRYRMETSIKKQQLLFALIGCGLLALVLLIIVRSYRLIRRKNRALCEQIEQQARRLQQEEAARREALAVREAQAASDNKPHLPLPAEPFASAPSANPVSELFARFSQLLTEEKLYLTSDISRDMLVDRLGTNKNKLTEAITTATGRTLTEYITELRLREALLLMEAQPDLPFTQIAEQTGFGVYSSFYRAFNKQYGVKPTEYRNYRKG